MKIFRKWLLKTLNKARREQDDQPEETVKMSAGYATNTIGSRDDVPMRMNFNVMPAAGGVVISINKYDRTKGQHTENLHVIHDDEDIATNIGHIVSMELLKS